jgi:hypothetical protein
MYSELILLCYEFILLQFDYVSDNDGRGFLSWLNAQKRINEVKVKWSNGLQDSSLLTACATTGVSNAFSF